ncbi:MAG TPA: PilN domain-containing protein [Gaiellaceae bacterium]|jgi:Tfp pilus assembly protein PilN|nr:PilN domain-containing protein [Gaiellaceae bacterium]
MRAVNLLPRDDAGEGRSGPALPVVVACVGLVLIAALLAFMYMSGSGKVGKQRTALQQVTAEYDAIPAPAPPPAIDKQLPQERQARVAALSTVLGQRVVWDRVLREVSQVVPSDVWLVTLTAQSPTYLDGGAAAPSAASSGQLPSGFIVEGCTYSQDSVARFLSRLQLVPDLSEMSLAKSESAGGSGSADTSGSTTSCPAGMFTFTLQGNVRTGGSSS